MYGDGFAEETVSRLIIDGHVSICWKKDWLERIGAEDLY